MDIEEEVAEGGFVGEANIVDEDDGALAEVALLDVVLEVVNPMVWVVGTDEVSAKDLCSLAVEVGLLFFGYSHDGEAVLQGGGESHDAGSGIVRWFECDSVGETTTGEEH